MKLFAPALIFCGAAGAFGQSPQVPHKMSFAGITLSIRDDARREIQKEVDALTQSPRYFNMKAERAKTYFPIIEKIFAEERLPDDFKFLALQESALVPDAVSASDAVGFWQFKDFTAREMGLRVDEDVDERMNIASASRGAARYLKQCNHYFNNWIYALQSYQMGAGGVMRAVGDSNLGTRHMEMNSDTYWYVKKFLAHKIAFEGAVTGTPAVSLTNIHTAGGKTLLEISKETSIEVQKLQDFNKWLRSDRIPTDKEYVVLIPQGESFPDFGFLTVATSKSKQPERIISAGEQKLEINGITVIRANPGESIVSIAARGGIRIKSFLQYNEMGLDKSLQSGQSYYLGRKKKRAIEELYTLKSGEDLWIVSQRFGVRQKSLSKFNDFEPGARLAPGLTLFLHYHKPAGMAENNVAIALLDEDNSFTWDQPVAAEKKRPVISLSAAKTMETEQFDSIRMETTASSPNTIHEVKPSDTLYSVARQYGVTIKELMEWNDKKDLSLSVGEKLKVRSR